ncbi:MBL fold metallo-hydrolase [Brevirhabdus sp.]|uniref:MBL fold metallo-hydrolase n=1 Tax=Brevirhabdus sp. TaxID=2004514 RepID=UPI004059A6F0
MPISRRQALTATAALPFAAALMPRAGGAAAHKMATARKTNSFALGDMQVTALLAGTRTVDNPHSIFGLNVSDDEFAEVSEQAFIPTDKAQFFFTPTLVKTGEKLVLFDTGNTGEDIAAALDSAGHTTDDVTTVVLTHMHGDHIGGLMTEGKPTFANADYVTGQVEYDAWAKMNNDKFDANVRPLADRMTFLKDGGDVASGITAREAFGHTPGHMTYMIDSGDRQMLLAADFANHYIWSVEHPEWEVKFDMDKQTAAASRKTILDMLAAERMPFLGYHMPFPAMGFIDKRDAGYRYVAESYQTMLG